jgi:hypothetical protein
MQQAKKKNFKSWWTRRSNEIYVITDNSSRILTFCRQNQISATVPQ